MFKNIFSKEISQGDKTIIKIFGIKICLKSSFAKEMIKKNPYYSCKKNNVDITQVPKATGQLRDVQLATFTLLKEFDKICKKENITYWIDYGTYLGAVRHKGFIPWDDDIDIGIVSDEFEKLNKIIGYDNTNSNICIIKSIGEDNKGYMYKFIHKNYPNIFIDIFVNIDRKEELSESKATTLTKEIKTLRKKHFKQFSKITQDEIASQADIFQNKIMEKCKGNSEENGNLMLSSTMTLWYDNWFRPKSLIFPLKEIEFEGQNFPCPNNSDEYLRLLYGDYMSYPKKLALNHNGYVKLNEEEQKKIKELASLNL